MTVALGLSAFNAQAQVPSFTSIAAPAEPGALPLDTGSVAGMPPESWLWDGQNYLVRNISRATLTPFLPPKGTASHSAVIIAPGGAFVGIAIENEGWKVARWLAARGVAAFVLKYRLRPTPQSAAALQQYLRDSQRRGLDLTVPDLTLKDAQAALRYVREHAASFDVDPKKVGMLGFSAGAITALSTVTHASPSEMPAFIAPIYGQMLPFNVPPAAPPMFVAYAADDPLFGKQGFGLVESWQRAGKDFELHVFEKGGHGFGLGAKGTTAAGWPDAFLGWLILHGFAKGQPQP